MKFIHVTDPHIVKPGKTLFGLDVHERLAKCIESINANHADAEFCIWTGDIVHWGDHASYHHFRDAVSALAMPSHLVMGNHDKRESLLDVFPDTPVDANPRLCSPFSTSPITPAGISIGGRGQTGSARVSAAAEVIPLAPPLMTITSSGSRFI